MEYFACNLLRLIDVTGHISECKMNLDTTGVLGRYFMGNVGQVELQLAAKYFKWFEIFSLPETESVCKSSLQSLDKWMGGKTDSPINLYPQPNKFNVAKCGFQKLEGRIKTSPETYPWSNLRETQKKLNWKALLKQLGTVFVKHLEASTSSTQYSSWD